MHPLSVDTKEQRRYLAPTGQSRAAVFEVLFNPGERSPANRHIPILAALALADTENAARKISERGN